MDQRVATFILLQLLHSTLGGQQNNLHLLDALLSKYDRRATPSNYLNVATKVYCELYIPSFGSIDPNSMDYQVDLYLRQTWVDQRLNHENITQPLDLNDPNLVKAIWKPEVYFPNAKHAEFQFVTVPNVLVRVNPFGEILYMLRLKLVFSCMLDLSKFPFDKQICTMEVASFSKTMKELDLRWKKDQPIKLDNRRLPQFEITHIVDSICSESFHIGNYSCLVAEFHMSRSLGFHLVQSYLPTILIVAVSWVSFWMDVDSVPGRTVLGVTTLLTISSKSSEIQGGLPQVSYIKAIDVWMGACTAFVFCALLEFTLVNYLWRKRPMASPFQRPSPHGDDNCASSSHGGQECHGHQKEGHGPQKEGEGSKECTFCNGKSGTCGEGGGGAGTEGDFYGNATAGVSHVSGRIPFANVAAEFPHISPQMLANFTRSNTRGLAQSIDTSARVLFPLSFGVFNIFYWFMYIS